MCYDLHRPGTGPGPVTDISWTEKNITHLTSHVQAWKIWLGVPLYGYLWSGLKKARAVSGRYGIKLAEKHGSMRHGSGTVYVSFKENGVSHSVFFSDAMTVKKMTELAREHGLMGTAYWRLGLQ